MDNIICKPVLLTRHHDTDAGFDLHIAEDVTCTAFKPIQIFYQEQFQLPPGKMAYLVGRSSSHKLGIIPTGVIDAGYCGKLSSTFLPFTDLQLAKGYRLAQVVVHDVARVQFTLGEFEASQRGDRGHGSSGFY